MPRVRTGCEGAQMMGSGVLIVVGDCCVDGRPRRSSSDAQSTVILLICLPVPPDPLFLLPPLGVLATRRRQNEGECRGGR